jgi:hypothetical protein
LDHTRNDPVDRERTTRQHAGESLLHGPNTPGIFGVAVGVVALVIGLLSLARGEETTGTVAIALAAGSAAAGVGWIMFAHRHVRRTEVTSAAAPLDRPPPPPAS